MEQVDPTPMYVIKIAGAVYRSGQVASALKIARTVNRSAIAPVVYRRAACKWIRPKSMWTVCGDNVEHRTTATTHGPTYTAIWTTLTNDFVLTTNYVALQPTRWLVDGSPSQLKVGPSSACFVRRVSTFSVARIGCGIWTRRTVDGNDIATRVFRSLSLPHRWSVARSGVPSLPISRSSTHVLRPTGRSSRRACRRRALRDSKLLPTCGGHHGKE